MPAGMRSPAHHVTSLLTLSVDDADEEHGVILLVGRVQPPLVLVSLRSLDAHVGRVDRSDAVAELNGPEWMRNPLLLLSSSPPANGIRCRQDAQQTSRVSDEQRCVRQRRRQAGRRACAAHHSRLPGASSRSMIVSTMSCRLLLMELAAQPKT